MQMFATAFLSALDFRLPIRKIGLGAKIEERWRGAWSRGAPVKKQSRRWKIDSAF